MTSENPTADRITNSIFQRISRDKAKDRAALRCPLCRDLLESLLLEKNEQGCQTVWWMCRNTMDQKCTFPMDIPPNVFWVERTPEQINEGYIPRPRLELLPPQYRYLYPDFFPDSAQSTPMTSRPTSAFSRVDSGVSFNSLHTRDMSLNSELVSVTTPQGTSCGESVVVCDVAEPEGTKSGSSLVNTTSKSSEGCGPSNSSRLARVPAVSKPYRKRVAAEPLHKTHLVSNMAFKRHVTLKGIQNEGMPAENYQVDPNEFTPTKTRNWASYQCIDSYTDSIAQSVPAVNYTEAHNILANRPLADRMSMVQHMRNARSGVQILDAIGVKGKLPPQENTWREETRHKVNESLNKAARPSSDFEKRLQSSLRMAKRERDAVSAVAIEAAPSTSADVTSIEEDREAERKAKALIMGKVHAQMEKRRQYLLQKVARIERRNASRASAHTATPPPAPEHYSMPIFNEFSSFPAVEPPPTSGEAHDEHFQDLFGDYTHDPLY